LAPQGCIAARFVLNRRFAGAFVATVSARDHVHDLRFSI
jgi:hypothetical protein